MQSRFQAQRERSKLYEIAFSDWLQRVRGYYVLPTYDYSGLANNKAPRLMCLDSGLVIPDLLAAGNGVFQWFEIKLKEKADLHRKSGNLVTGLPYRHWLDYQRVKQVTGSLVWIVFIHETENVICAGEIDNMPHSHI